MVMTIRPYLVLLLQGTNVMPLMHNVKMTPFSFLSHQNFMFFQIVFLKASILFSSIL